MAYPFAPQPPSNDNDADFDPLAIAMGQPVVPDKGEYDAASSDYIAAAYADIGPDFAATVNGKSTKIEVLLPTGEFLNIIPKPCGCCSCSGDGPNPQACPCGQDGVEAGWCVKHKWHEA